MDLKITKEWLERHKDDDGDCSAGSPDAIRRWLTHQELLDTMSPEQVQRVKERAAVLIQQEKKLQQIKKVIDERMFEWIVRRVESGDDTSIDIMYETCERNGRFKKAARKSPGKGSGINPEQRSS